MAATLGVHYMTAYRYVRLGQLQARKHGAVWTVQQGDLDRFRRALDAGTSTGASTGTRTGTPADGAGDLGAAAPVTGRGRSRPAPWSARFEARLVAGDGAGAWNVVEAALASGAEPASLYLDVIAPAMRRIGEAWAAGELDVAAEHQASGIAMRVVGRLGSRFVRRGRTRGSVLVGGPAGEHHSLPIALLADLLRGGGWEVFDLGCNVPPDAFVAAVDRTERLVAVGVSVTDPSCLAAAGAAIAAIRVRSPGVPVLAGGGALPHADAALAIGADAWACDGRQALAVLESLVGPPAAGGDR